MKGRLSVKNEVKVHSISMKTLCENYYVKRPNFLNLDIEGHGAQALLTNDWSNPKCVPEIVFS